MKTTFTLIFIFLFFNAFSQIDTVVIRPDSSFESRFHRKLYDKRTNVKYHLVEWANVRDMVVYMATLEELATGKKMYAVRIDERLNRNLFTDAPVFNAEYIDEDELETFLGYLNKIRKEIMSSDLNKQRYSEYRFYTRAGIMLECYTGVNRWRCVIHYEIDKLPNNTYINNPERLDELIQAFTEINNEIKNQRKNDK